MRADLLLQPKTKDSVPSSAKPEPQPEWPSVQSLGVEFCGALMIASGTGAIPIAVLIIATMVGLRDAYYFFPDCTPSATLVLASAGAYTINYPLDQTVASQWRRTQKVEILCRLCIQLIASVVASTQGEVGTPWTEFITTFIESIVIAFAILPLLANSNCQAVNSKAEADPPRTRDVALTALALGITHYALDIAFHASGNLFLSLWKHEWGIFFAQLGAVVLAGLYSYFSIPSQDKLRKIYPT